MNSRKKFIIPGLVALIVLSAIFLGAAAKPGQAPPYSQSNTSGPAKKSTSPRTIKLIAGGDFLPHDSVNLNAKTDGGYDYQQFFVPLKSEFEAADIVFCNQESPSAPDISVSGYPSFNAPREFARDLSGVGCNVISLANNHLLDRGQAGIDGTRSVWDELNPLAVSGANRNQNEQDKVSYFEVKGVKFAFVAYSEISNQPPAASYSLNRLSDSLVAKQLRQAEDNADFVIVSAHWGTEYSVSPNSAQKSWAKKFADLGADFVFGSGPHVLQPVDKLAKAGGGETIVFYSLGNLLSTQLDIVSLIGGLAVLEIDVASKKIGQIGFYPTYMHYEWTAEQKAREDLLARKNLKIYPLEQAAEPLAKSQNNTTVQAQTQRITDLLNKFTAVKILSLKDF